MSFRLFTTVLISIRATHTHSRPLSFNVIHIHPPLLKPVPLKPVPLKPVPLKPVPLKPVPLKPVPLKPVPLKPVLIKSLSIIDSPYFHHLRNKKNTIMEIMDLYNKIKK